MTGSRYLGDNRNVNKPFNESWPAMNYFIFDVDGTLIDSEQMYMLPLQKVLKKHGYDVSDAAVERVFGITAADALKILKVRDPEQIQKEWFAEISNFKQYAHVYPGIKAALGVLHADPANQMAIATSKVEAEFHRDVTRFNLDDFFDAFVFSNEIKRGKPAPDLVLKGIEKLSASLEATIYIGDTIYDMQAAHAANVAFGLAGWRTKKTAAFKDADYNFETPAEMLKIDPLSD